ncbi:MAG: M36 family metallopeptidase [Pirellulales bacterium]
MCGENLWEPMTASERELFLDAREASEPRPLVSLSASRSAGFEQSGVGEELGSFYLPPQLRLSNPDRFLTGPQAGDPRDIVLRYLGEHAGDWGRNVEDTRGYVVTDQYTDADSGMTYIYLRQVLDGLEVMNADLNASVTSRGEIIQVSSTFIQDTHLADGMGPLFVISAERAYFSLSERLGLGGELEQRAKGNLPTIRELSREESLREEGVSAQLVYVPTAGGLELAWRLSVSRKELGQWYDGFVDADSGDTLFVDEWNGHATYEVFPAPLESPYAGVRSLVIDPSDSLASPWGWHDTNGVLGAEFQDTRGNNASVQEDGDHNDIGGFRPTAGAGLDFSFPLATNQNPAAYQAAAITNLFYWVNLLHDIHYQYGFTEVAGNFQVNNYGRGGIGNDPVIADIHDGDGGGPSFVTFPDGQSPRMQLYVNTTVSPARDAALDNTILIHEFGHGVSERLTGGPANTTALNALQSAGMSEGWSDWWALMFTQTAADAKLDAFPVGNYFLGEGPEGDGARRYPYSFDKAINPLTLGSFNGGAANNSRHKAGEIWCAALWDLNWLLIEKHGFSSDLYHGNGGNNLALQLIMDGLKIQGANPSFLVGRNAILAADQVLTGGQNQAEIWSAFARRGMGFSSSDGGGANSATVTEAFDVPGQISGTVYRDDDADGSRDPGEPGLAGWTVYRDLNNNGQLDVPLVSQFSSSDAPKTIVDKGTTYSTLNLSGLSGNILDVNIQVNLSHPAVGELNLALISPTGTPVILSQFLGGSGDDFANSVFDDEASVSIISAAAPFTGAFRPVHGLSQLDGRSPNGQWRLRLDDVTSGNVGTLLGWSMFITYGTPDVSAITDESGRYAFFGLGAGTHRIRDEQRLGITSKAPVAGVHEVVISAGQVVSDVDFGHHASTEVDAINTLEDTLSEPISVRPPAGLGATRVRIDGLYGGQLFLVDGVSPIVDGSFITVAQAQSGLRFLPTLNSHDPGRFEIELYGDGPNALYGTSKSTAVVTVTGVNDAPLLNTLSAPSITENLPAGTLVATLDAVDVDAGDTLTFSLVSGVGDDDNHRFTMSADGRLWSAIPFDFEQQRTLSARVRVEDAGHLFTEQVLVVSVLDLVEESVVISGTGGDDLLTVSYMAGEIEVTLSSNGDAPQNLGVYTANSPLVVDGKGGADRLLLTMTPRQLDSLTTRDLLALKDYLYSPSEMELDISFFTSGRLQLLDFETMSLLARDGSELRELAGCLGPIQSSEQIQAGDDQENDTLFGTSLTDLIFGEGGDDVIDGMDGADCLWGGAGDDEIWGGSGDDEMFGGDGNDLLHGDFGFDRLQGGDGMDWLSGGLHDDQLEGGPGNDSVEGNAGYDVIRVSGDDSVYDIIDGGDNTDSILNIGNSPVVLSTFDAGASQVEGWIGNNQPIYGTEEADVIIFLINGSSSMSLSAVPYIDGRGGDDTIIGTFGMDNLRGGDGNDRLDGLGGVDALYGDAGDDRLSGGDGTDYLLGGAGADVIETGAGRDIVVFAVDDLAEDVIADFALYSDRISLAAYHISYATLAFDRVSSPGSTLVRVPGGKSIRLLQWNRIVASSQFVL